MAADPSYLIVGDKTKARLKNHDYAVSYVLGQREAIVELETIANAARDFVSLWQAQKIEGLPRAERNAAIEDTRQRLIDAVTETAIWMIPNPSNETGK